jgi:hypothetical protein
MAQRQSPVRLRRCVRMRHPGDLAVMARMSIDDMVCRDPRITVLASLVGWSRRETVGCLVLDIWPICYDQRTWLVSERVIDAAAAHIGFAAALIEAELAVRDRSGRVRIKGAKERIEYLERKSAAGRQGGLNSAESRRNAPKHSSSTTGSTPQAPRNPPVPDPSPPSAPDPVPPPVLVLEECASLPLAPLPKLKRKVDVVTGPHQEAVAAFQSYFQRTHEGASPDWDGKTGALVKGLLRRHGFPEFLRRLENLEHAPPSFPSAPWDLATFAQHFDKCATRNASRRTAPESALEVALRLAGGSP